jgi:sarcosine oxidase
MKKKFDVIVLGLGAMGSATIYHLAQRGIRVLGIDQYSPPHVYGSTHGASRIIRQAIGEGEAYVPLVLRSYELWREIERRSGKKLLTITGGLVLETQQGAATAQRRRNFFDRTIACAERYDIPHEILETKDLKRRFPQFAVNDERGYFESGAGFLQPELCVEVELALARRFGASLQMNQKVLAVDPEGSAGVTVRTNSAVYQADRLVVAAGAWIGDFLPPGDAQHFSVYRQVMYWFAIKDGSAQTFAPQTCPIFIWVVEKGGHIGFYGFPSLDGRSIKMATEQFGSITAPDRMDRTVSAEEAQSVYQECLYGRVPGVSNVCETAASCLYTMTPDADFVIDFLPGNDRILIASPCSGHGFKHSAAVGEVIAQLLLDGKSKIDVSSFSIKRFST